MDQRTSYHYHTQAARTMRQATLLGDALGFAYGPVVNPDQNTPTCWGRPGESHHPLPPPTPIPASCFSLTPNTSACWPFHTASARLF